MKRGKGEQKRTPRVLDPPLTKGKPFDPKRTKFRPVNTGTAVQFEKSGQSVVGRYAGFVKRIIEGDERHLHRFTDSNGGPFTVWGSTVIESGLEGVAHGTIVRITYLGQKGKGQRKYNNFSIEVS